MLIKLHEKVEHNSSHLRVKRLFRNTELGSLIFLSANYLELKRNSTFKI